MQILSAAIFGVINEASPYSAIYTTGEALRLTGLVLLLPRTVTSAACIEAALPAAILLVAPTFTTLARPAQQPMLEDFHTLAIGKQRAA